VTVAGCAARRWPRGGAPRYLAVGAGASRTARRGRTGVGVVPTVSPGSAGRERG
jgi:hypothetical protein